MPHEKRFIKTKEGYLVAIEEILNLNENLPFRFYSLSIEKVIFIYEWTVLSGKVGFLDACKDLDIKTDGVFDEK